MKYDFRPKSSKIASKIMNFRCFDEKKAAHPLIVGLPNKQKKWRTAMKSHSSPKYVYLGIDVHKKTYSITAISEKQIIKKDTIHASPENLMRYCQKYFPESTIESAYEAGFSGFSLHRYLKKCGILSHVIHPASIEISSRDRVKTDKRDSLKIAVQLSEGRLRDICIPTEEREGYWSLTRLRESFLRHRNRIGCQLKSFLLFHGLNHLYQDYACSEKWITSLLRNNNVSEIQYGIQHYARTWLEFNSKIKEIEMNMKKQAEKDIALDEVYQSAPGIGPIAARILANELGDMSQFKNERALFSYIGLTPCEYSSGEHKRKGHISRQGRSIIRKIIVQCAWMAIRQDEELASVFDRIRRRAGAKRAIVAVARRFIGRIRACFKNGCFYQITKKSLEMSKDDLVNVSCELS